AENDVRDITHPLGSPWADEVSGWSMGDDLRLFQISQEQIKNVTQSCSCIPHAVREMQPSLMGLDGRRTEAVFYLFYRVVLAVVHDHFLLDNRVFHALGKSPPDTASLTSLNELILRPCVKRVLRIHELRVQHHVPLLGRLGLQVGQPVPAL